MWPSEATQALVLASATLPRARRNHPHLADGEGQPPGAAVYERLGAVREEWLEYSRAV
jgi:hypothetical protein